jgi:hypothetical protein
MRNLVLKFGLNKETIVNLVHAPGQVEKLQGTPAIAYLRDNMDMILSGDTTPMIKGKNYLEHNPFVVNTGAHPADVPWMMERGGIVMYNGKPLPHSGGTNCLAVDMRKASVIAERSVRHNPTGNIFLDSINFTARWSVFYNNVKWMEEQFFPLAVYRSLSAIKNKRPEGTKVLGNCLVGKIDSETLDWFLNDIFDAAIGETLPLAITMRPSDEVISNIAYWLSIMDRWSGKRDIGYVITCLKTPEPGSDTWCKAMICALALCEIGHPNTAIGCQPDYTQSWHYIPPWQNLLGTISGPLEINGRLFSRKFSNGRLSVNLDTGYIYYPGGMSTWTT